MNQLLEHGMQDLQQLRDAGIQVYIVKNAESLMQHTKQLKRSEKQQVKQKKQRKSSKT